MTQNQHTLAKSVSLSGSSLHTGEEVTLTLRPAPVGHGKAFRRSDIPDSPAVQAHIGHVKEVERRTTLVDGPGTVHTVEHILSALSGLGVDNCLIEMDASEPPICDGSSRPYVELIKSAGLVDQGHPRTVWEITEPIHIEAKNGALMTIVPDPAFRVSCTNVGPEGRFTQFQSLTITPEIYEKEIAPARTFVFYEEVKPLMDKGLIKGGSLENALVVRGEQVLSKEALRFKDEFVRHKILDIVGDLALFGRPIRGHVIAIKPGHGPNSELCAAIAKQHAKAMAMVPPSVTPKGGEVMDVNDVMKLLPHRFPFLMVDRVVSIEGDSKCTGIKQLSINEHFFQGHFPGHPIMPGVLQLEAMAQVGSILLLRKPGYAGKIGYFMSADGVKFRKPVVPGDTLFIEVEMTQNKRALAKARGRCIVNNEVVSEAEMLFGVVDA
jgi:UDP-3-O-[3-hydroxymyristoyl] N-acetylglucosamine deacetylase / 3-hydroxyacyl-[acyl-carrier-protein] dehydratase